MKRKQIVLIVTGGVAMGKSSTAEILCSLLPSHRLFDADACVSKLLTEPEICTMIASEFGESALGQNGSVNRSFLRDQVFDSVDRRAALENILHPEVRKRFETLKVETAKSGTELLIADIPLFFESGSHYPNDFVLVVAADAQSQFRRLADRPGITTEMAEKIVAAQLPIMEKMTEATAVIWNSGSRRQLETQIQFFTRWLKTKI